MVMTTPTASAPLCSISTSTHPRRPSGAAAASRTSSSAAVQQSSSRSFPSKQHKNNKASSVASSTFFERRRLGRNSSPSSSSSTKMTATDYYSSTSHAARSGNEKEGDRRHTPQHSSLGSSSSSSSASSFGKCPLCSATLPLHRLGWHASECNGAVNESSGGTDTNDDDAYAASSFTSPSSLGGCCLLQGGRRVVEASSIETNPHPARSEVPFPIPMPLLSGTSNRGNHDASSTRTSPSKNATGTDVPIRGGQELPPGLFLYDNFISQEEEELILRELDKHDANWKLSSFNGTSYGKRWGVHCRLKDRCVTEAETPLPAFITQLLLPRLRDLAPMTIQSKSGTASSTQLVIPNEANAIDYRKSLGHWLQSHVDDRHLSKEPIANLSLAGDCVMTYTLIEGQGSSRSIVTPAGQPPMKNEYRVLLSRRTLQILTGAVRYRYQHGIHNHDLLSERRVSITMRESPLTKAPKATGPRRPPMSVVPSNSVGHIAGTTAGGIATPLSLSAAAPWWKRRRVLDGAPSHNCMAPKAVSSSNPVPGLFVIEDFVTEEEEAMILSELEHGLAGGEAAKDVVVDRSSSQLSGHPTWKSERHTGTHREKRYGRDSDLWSRAVRDPRYPLPAFVHTILLPKLRCYSHVRELMAGWSPNEGNAIEYRRDHNNWLKAHVDDRRKHKELIANLSLAGDCYMTFAPASVPSSGTSATAAPPASSSTKVLLRRRTLTLLTGKARYEYTHGIDPTDLLSDRRVSFTLRETV